MTLIEIVISSGLVGIIMIVIMVLLGRVGDIATVFQGQASTMEAVAESVAIMNSIVPLTTRIEACACQASPGTRANCVWNESTPWYDPVFDGGVASPVTILQGEFEAHSGPTTDLTEILNPGSFAGQNCNDHNSSLSSDIWRGCKQDFRIDYYPPTPMNLAGKIASKAGKIELWVGTRTKPSVQIGENTERGKDGIGVTTMSCGFDNSSGGTTGASAIYVLNFKIKSKSNIVGNVEHRNYESWYPSSNEADFLPGGASSNYPRGQFREVHLKFPMRNISTRGIYAWRAESVRSCKVNGQAASNVAECCSQALSGGSCVACVRAGQSGSNSSCCSGTASGGTCL